MNPTQIAPGARIDGRYELIARLGVGATGEVWRAHDAKLDQRPVAIKLCEASFVTQPELVARFESEADALVHRVLQHTPQVIDRGIVGELHYVVTELVDGVGLRALIDPSPAVPQTVAMGAFAPPSHNYAQPPMGFPPPTPYGAQGPNAFAPPGYGPTAAMPGYAPGPPMTAAPWPQQPYPQQPYPMPAPSSGVPFAPLVMGALFMGLIAASGAWFAMRTRTPPREYSTATPLTTLPTPYVPPRFNPPTRPTARPGDDPDRVYVVRDDPSAASIGPSAAPVTVVTFSDFQCPFCGRVNPTLERLRERYPAQVRIVWRNYPLSFHVNAMPAAEAAREVLRQRGNEGFWRYHAMLFENQRALTTEDLVRYAEAVGADGRRVRQSLYDHRHQLSVRDDMAAYDASGARPGTPAFFINGRMLRGAQPFERFCEAVDRALAEGVDRR